MTTEFPKVDPRGAEDIFEQAKWLAWYYCPEWRQGDEDQFGLTLLKLFARLAEIVIGQLNRIPEKHLLAFYDFIGMDFAPATVAKVPLTFQLAAGAREASVPERTKVAAAGTETVFETINPLAMVDLKIIEAYSVNPWADQYTGHSGVVDGLETGFRIFGGDGAETPVEHLLGLADPAFGCGTPADLTLAVTFSNFQEVFPVYFSRCADGNGTVLEPAITGDGLRNQVVFKFSNLKLPRTVLQGRENHWLLFRPARPLPWGQQAVLPEITGISVNLAAQGLIPEMVLVNDTPVELQKGFYPFGEMPRAGDAFYIRCEEAFRGLEPGTGGMVELSFRIKGGVGSGELELAWEYWDGACWTPLSIISDNTQRFLESEVGEFTGTIQFTCLGITTTILNDLPGKWIRVRIAGGGYGEPGHYQAVPLEEILKTDDGMGEKLAEIMKSDAKFGEKFADRLSHDDLEAKQFKGRIDRFLQEFQQELFIRLGEKMITSGSVYQPPNFKPPFIVSIRAAYSFTKTGLRETLAVDHWECREMSNNQAFQPFSPSLEKPALFLGLEGNPANQPAAFFFACKPGLAGQTGVRLTEPGYRGELTFENKSSGLLVACAVGDGGTIGDGNTVSGEEEWMELAAEDETGGFLQSGVIKFILPGNLARRTLFGKNCYWLKLGFRDGNWIEPPVLKGIYPNTVWAEQAMVIRDETLGSSNGRPGQTFHFCRKSLLGNPVIEVREPCIPTPEELRKLSAVENGEPLRLVKNEAGDPVEIWVRWREVPVFGQSDSLSRHYLLDRINGRILFGDGAHGMIPPVSANNLVARFYKCGGGAAGNQASGTVTELKTSIPRVAGVANPEAAAGGKDLETITKFFNRVPVTLKTGGLAVTGEDYERLAGEASIQVLKAKCLVNEEGAIRIIIAPTPETGSRIPEVGLTGRVAGYLKERTLAPIRERIRVTGPDYKLIDLALTLRPVSLAAAAVIKEQVHRRLERFFDLVTGGPQEKGWDFGQDLFLSDVAAVLGEVEGVTQIMDLLLIKKDREGREEDRSLITATSERKTWITIQPWELPELGKVTVNLTGGEI